MKNPTTVEVCARFLLTLDKEDAKKITEEAIDKIAAETDFTHQVNAVQIDSVTNHKQAKQNFAL